MTPSATKPHYICPYQGCQAISGPAAIKTATGHELLGGTQVVGGGPAGGYTAEELELAYDIPTTGGREPEQQTVAVIEARGDATAESDLAEYREKYKLGECKKENAKKEVTNCFRKVNQKGEEANYPANEVLWSFETSIDVDMVSAACPECHILLVEANNEEESEMGAAVNKAVALGATEISVSYGFPETYKARCAEATGCSEYQSDYNHPGIPITAAAGDDGYDNVYAPVELTKPAPLFPASAPNVIAVGGTALYLEKGARSSETVWPLSGSGCSLFEVSKPTGQAEAERKFNRSGCAAKRTDNDIAADSSCETPVSLYDTPGIGGWSYACGTSVAAPLIAGIEAHASKYTRSLGAAAFYKKPSILFHVSEGSNGECGTESESKWYLCNATKEGYNGPTGMGTPTGVFDVNEPSALTGSAKTVTETEATLTGTVNPNGLATKYYFEYGPTTSYGTKTAEVSAGSGSSSVEASTAIAGLAAATKYHFRIVATSSGGTTDGIDLAFTTAASKPTAETKPAAGVIEKGATLKGTVNPHGFETKYYFEYGPTVSYGTKTAEASAGAGTSGVEEGKTISGLAAGTTYHFRMVATSSKGTADGADETVHTPAWVVQETTNKSAFNTALNGDDCTSATACIAVGNYVNSEPHNNVHFAAESWNGTSWSAVQEPPTIAGKGGINGGLYDVSCSSSAACVAVGSIAYESGKSTPAADKWNGTEWSLLEPLTPKEASFVFLHGVSCTSSESCTAVGQYFTPTDKMLIEHWSGKEWTIQEAPAPKEAKETSLNGVSCTSASACVAVGSFLNSSSKYQPFAETWNGMEWSVKELPVPTGAKSTELRDVSCSASTACQAVGDFFNSAEEERPLGERWNGTAWSAQEPPAPSGIVKKTNFTILYLEHVSCSTSGECVTTGSFENSAEKWVPLAEAWSGTEWFEEEPTVPTGAASYTWLWDVSCSAATTCTSVGTYYASKGGQVTLAERYQ